TFYFLRDLLSTGFSSRGLYSRDLPTLKMIFSLTAETESFKFSLAISF
ncbi:MAG: hypothetical protein ACJAUP_001242, partial [Cellvibrionaceae bacterium]